MNDFELLWGIILCPWCSGLGCVKSFLPWRMSRECLYCSGRGCFKETEDGEYEKEFRLEDS